MYLQWIYGNITVLLQGMTSPIFKDKKTEVRGLSNLHMVIQLKHGRVWGAPEVTTVPSATSK